MTVTLNHTIVPSRDKHASAAFLAQVLGVRLGKPFGPFVPVHINNELTLDFADIGHRDVGAPHHYAFLVGEAEFDEILARIKAQQVRFYAEPHEPHRYGEINTARGGRTVYFDDPDGHVMEIMTKAQ